MKVFFFAILALALATPDYLITQEMTDYLKKHVTWDVVDYEENLFRGWTIEEIQSILGDSMVAGDEVIPFEEAPTAEETGASCTHDIHNQGNCGSCWAFATASVVSDRCCQETKDQGWLAPQELVSCDKANGGCNGGLAKTALDYVKANGLVPEACYPYKAVGEACPTKCKDGSDWKKAHVCKFNDKVDCSQDAGMKKCLVDLKYNAITVRMIVYNDFMAYKGGIYCHKTGNSLGGHAIRAVGYGTTPVIHLTCANSWGPSWGEKGYFRIEAKETCGLRMTPGDAWSPAKFIA